MIPAPPKSRRIAEMGTTIWKDPASLRFLRPWMRSLRPGHSPVADGLPLMNFEVIRWLDRTLSPSMNVFEYGTGGSTLYVAPRAARLTSVEHDPEWVGRVSRALQARRITNCDLKFVPAAKEPNTEGRAYGPGSYTSFAPHTAGYSFEAYVRTIDGYSDGAFDLVIVDGYARASAVAHAIPKVRRGGFLLLDDSDREYTRPAIPLLDGFPREDFLSVTPFQRNLQKASVWRL